MKITTEDVAYVAKLANLDFTAEESGRMLRDLNSILDYVDRLNELDTADVPAMGQFSFDDPAHALAGDGSPAGNSDREDVIDGLRKPLPHHEALANAPDTDGTFFRVPKVIER